MTFRIALDRDACQDHGQCVYAAPGVFELDEDGRLVVLVEEPSDELRSDVEDAVDVCPVQALRIID